MITGGNGISAEHYYGIITKAVGGIYFVDALSGADGEPTGQSFRCAARGIFRQNGISPSAGDRVVVEWQENQEPLISKVLERQNFLIRPPLANLDGIVFVISCADPAPNRFVLDKLIAIADSKGIEPMIAFTKPDLKQEDGLSDVYRSIGINVCMVNNLTGEGAAPVREFINGRLTAFIGNSGVGKSSLFNVLFPQLKLETGITSKKLGRGKHTTRQVQLFRLWELDSEMSGYAADTPGFSTVDTERYCRIPARELDNSFREFQKFADKCRFADCSHIKESECAVRAAAECGEIAQSRYDSYLRMYEEASKINEWE